MTTPLLWVNSLLATPTRLLRAHKTPLSWALLVLAWATVGLYWVPNSTPMTGRLAWCLLLVVVFVGPLFRVTRMPILGALLGYRRELGIMMGIVVLVHASVFLQGYPVDLGIGAAIIAVILSTLLLVTSNNASIKLLKKNWKRLHNLIPLILVGGGIHAALISGHYLVYGLPVVLYVIVKILDVRGVCVGKT